MAVRSRGGGRAPGEETCEAHCSNCDLELKKETVKQTEQLAGDRGYRHPFAAGYEYVSITVYIYGRCVSKFGCGLAFKAMINTTSKGKDKGSILEATTCKSGPGLLSSDRADRNYTLKCWDQAGCTGIQLNSPPSPSQLLRHITAWRLAQLLHAHMRKQHQPCIYSSQTELSMVACFPDPGFATMCSVKWGS
eukprot:1138494-Pelagomonas_calceolata.AAC.3